MLANIRLDEDVSKKSFAYIFKTSARRLHQDGYIRLTHTSSEDVFKTSWRRLDQDQYTRLGHTSSRHLQDVFKTSSRRPQDVFKMFSRLLQDVLQKLLLEIFKTLSTRFQNVFKTFSRCIIKLNCSCQHVFEMSSRYIRNVSETYFKDAYL